MGLIQVPDISDIFADDVIQPLGIKPTELSHILVNSRLAKILYEEAIYLIEQLKSRVSLEHKIKTGTTLNYRDLGEHQPIIRNRFLVDPRFKQVLSILNLNYTDRQLIEHPYWNELITGEADFRFNTSILLPQHSFEFQMSRNGKPTGPKNILLAGIVQAKDGEYVIALRAGDYYPNTFHSLVCSVNASDKLKNSEVTLYDVFVTNVLGPKTGLSSNDINHDDSHVLARLDDRLHHGIIYAFLIHSNLTSEEIKEKWIPKDKKELIVLQHDDIRPFIETHYVGKVINNPRRPDEERYLLHQGALVLASVIGMQPEDLKKLYKPGNH